MKKAFSVLAPLCAMSRMLRGVAADYWHDGPPPAFWVKLKSSLTEEVRKGRARGAAHKAENKDKAQKPQKMREFSGARCEVLEAMWGEGFCLPGEHAFGEILTNPLGLTKDTSVLDLSAGFGAIGRHLSEKMNIYVTGLEPDAEVAQAGMAMSQSIKKTSQLPISFYVPENFVAEKRYQCIVARELFYKVPQKEVFLAEIGKSLISDLKMRSQFAFTDFVLEPAALQKAEVKAWMAYETGARPMTIKVVEKMLAQNRLELRVKEDLTERYVREIFRGFRRLTLFLASHHFSSETTALVLKEVKTWQMRVAAMKQGLKLYRFYAIKL